MNLGGLQRAVSEIEGRSTGKTLVVSRVPGYVIGIKGQFILKCCSGRLPSGFRNLSNDGLLLAHNQRLIRHFRRVFSASFCDLRELGHRRLKFVVLLKEIIWRLNLLNLHDRLVRTVLQRYFVIQILGMMALELVNKKLVLRSVLYLAGNRFHSTQNTSEIPDSASGSSLWTTSRIAVIRV